MRRTALLLALALISPAAGCGSIFFYPMKPLIRTPADLGLAYRDVWFVAEDGTRVHGWRLDAERPPGEEPCGTVLFLHGNAENISTHIGSVYWLPAEGFDVVLLDYRGYGRSEGRPSLEGALKDIESALCALASEPGVEARGLVVFGQSLGGSLALRGVAESSCAGPVRLLVSDSAFFGFRRVVRDTLGKLWPLRPFKYPLSWLIADGLSPGRVIEELAPLPLVIIHGEEDPIVPVEHASLLFEKAKPPAELWRVAGAGHIGALRHPLPRRRYIKLLKDAFHSCIEEEQGGFQEIPSAAPVDVGPIPDDQG